MLGEHLAPDSLRVVGLDGGEASDASEAAGNGGGGGAHVAPHDIDLLASGRTRKGEKVLVHEGGDVVVGVNEGEVVAGCDPDANVAGEPLANVLLVVDDAHVVGGVPRVALAHGKGGVR